jgi:surfeit locus 1 family protein
MTAEGTSGPRVFRPTLVATLTTIPAIVVMLGLGTWQLQRLEWKADLIARVTERAAAAPVALPVALDDPAAWEFRSVTLSGQFLNDREMLLLARPRQGQAGYEVMTPFQRADGGGVVLVNRGFVPMDKRAAASRASGRVDGPTNLRGVVRLPQSAGLFQPDNAPGAEVWMRADPAAMAADRTLGPVASFMVEALPGQAPGDLPAGIEPRVELPNNHAQYALTWYGLAVTLAVVYVLSQRKSRRDGESNKQAA